ncbi:MAG: PDZ domain-containing protein [Rhizobiales bacterium]|nr:PDZ domain-containing protein [Hyphomicrobiales bacterium]
MIRVALVASVMAMSVAASLPVHGGDAVSAMDSVVSVLPDWLGRPPNFDEPEGSGVVIGDGRTVVTAAHVLGNAQRVLVRTRDGDIVAARIKAADKATDLAVLEIDAPLVALRFAGDAKVGQRACAIGNAFGLGISMTCGTVSAVNRAGVGFNAIEDFVQTDAAVNPGASGGALVDAQGRLIGVLSAIFTKQSDANIGVNFAVSGPLAERVVAGLEGNGQIAWHFAGLRLKVYPAKGETGRQAAWVAQVRGDSASALAGLKPGDRIVRAAGRRIRKPQELRGALARLKPGDKIVLDYVRAGMKARTELTMN